MDVDGTFGLEEGNTWEPFTYAEREKVAKTVVTLAQMAMKKGKKENHERAKTVMTNIRASEEGNFPVSIL